MNLLEVEQELKKRCVPKYKWGIKQVDIWDSQTNFVFSYDQFDEVNNEIQLRFNAHAQLDAIRDYALSRWYNYVANRALISIFISHPLVRQLKDDVDFFIDGMSFQVEELVFQANSGESFEEASKDKKAYLDGWIKHNHVEDFTTNTICIVFHSITDEDWKLKSELTWLKHEIYTYLDRFSRENLIHQKQRSGLVYVDVLFCGR